MRQIFRALHPRQRFVYRHRPDRHRRRLNDRLADLRDVPARRQVHHRVRAVVHRVMQLLQLFVNVRRRRRVPDVRVDLALERHADAHRLQRFVMNVRRNDRPPARDLAAHQLRLDLLPPRHVLHLFRDHALARVVHLRNVARPVGRRRLLQPLLHPSLSHSHRFPLKSLHSRSISLVR